jgi:cytochrome c551/c552
MDRLLRADGQRRSQIVNNGPLLFLGILGTLAVSFWSLLLAPQLQLGGQQQVVLEANGQLYPAPRSGEAQQGAEVYRANGCVECHSRQVRQTGVAFEVWLAELGTNAAAVMTALKELNLQSANIAALPAKITGGLAVPSSRRSAPTSGAAGDRACPWRRITSSIPRCCSAAIALAPTLPAWARGCPIPTGICGISTRRARWSPAR